jgi:electron transfer flavoprotein alpha subunit
LYMETILFLAFTEADGSLGKPALDALGAAIAIKNSQAGAPFVAGLIGNTIQPAADQIAACGASKFLGVAGADFAQARYATDATAAETLAKAAGASIIIAPATSRANRVLSGVAQRLGGRVDTHVAGVAAADGTLSITRWYYRQRMEAIVQRTARPWIILAESGAAPAWQGAAGKAVIDNVAITLSDAQKRTAVLSVRSPSADAQTIRPDAALLFVTGAGWTKKQADGQPHVKEAEELIWSFLKKTRASLGSSKSLVDLGGEGQAVLPFLTHLNQIGQTGSTPRHPKGLSTCCHGEEPHTVGWRFINERRAISLDPNCGWARGKADVLYVADAFAVMQKVNELL